MFAVHYWRSGRNELSWLASPIFERSSLMFLGVGKSLMAGLILGWIGLYAFVADNVSGKLDFVADLQFLPRNIVGLATLKDNVYSLPHLVGCGGPNDCVIYNLQEPVETFDGDVRV